MAFNASITNISETDQKIEISISSVSFDSNEPLIEKITLNIANISNSTIVFIPEKCYFQDNNGFHYLKIPPINLRSNNNINLPIESIDYYHTEISTGGYTYGRLYFGSSQSTTSMKDLNVSYLEINFRYIYLDKEYIGIYKIDVHKINVNKE
jgi:hypothetical protein